MSRWQDTQDALSADPREVTPLACRALPRWALVCDGYDTAGDLFAHYLGGGFQLTIPAAEEGRFHVVERGNAV